MVIWNRPTQLIESGRRWTKAAVFLGFINTCCNRNGATCISDTVFPQPCTKAWPACMKHLQFTRELDLCNNKNRKKGKTNSLRNSLKKGLQSFPSPRPRSKSHWKIAARIWGEKEIGWFGLLSNGGSTKCDRPIFTPYCTNVQSEQGCWLHKLGTPLLFQGVTNIRIFKKIRIFSNTFVSYLYNFFDTNIFGYSFVSFFLDINILEYLFVSKFHIRHTLLCSAGYLDIPILWLNP